MGTRVSPAGSRRDRDRPKLGARLHNAAIWKTPRSALAFILSVETLGVTWLVIANASDTVGLPDIGRFALLLLIAVAYAEGGDRIEVLRRYVGYVENSMIGNAASLWCFAAALVLPVGLAGAFTALIYSHNLLRSVRKQSAQPYRMVYTATTEVLAAMAAATVIAHFDPSTVILGDSLKSVVAAVLAMITYAVVNQGLISTVLYMVVQPTSVRAVMMTPEDETLEFATLALAVLFAVTVAHAPYLAPFTLPLIVVLRRSALVRELQVQATRDAKTGLLNAGAWRQEAERQLVRSERLGGQMSVLMVDLDHFKRLNDTYGHPAGDATLRVVAECLTDALRGYDAVGRFGGEEFIALLADADQTVSQLVADRLCARIRKLELSHGNGVTASIGVGVGIAGTHDLDDLIGVADKALYVAKGSGRDQVYTICAAQPVAPQAMQVVKPAQSRPIAS
jgi:diguanylate cyclase (GGDEF)-like protein